MKLYEVSVKYGNSRYHLKAYVEGKNKDDALVRYCGDAERYERNLLGGIKFRAKLAKLP